MTKTFTPEFLSEQTLVTEGLEYSSDEDGNISLHQENMFITLTTNQALDLKELLDAHLDTLKFAWSRKWNTNTTKRSDVLMIVIRKY